VLADDKSLTDESMLGSPQPGATRVDDGSDELYTRGMGHYRRREWADAKACFMRLKSMAPDRRGIDALLNEVDIFIQLQELQPGAAELQPSTPASQLRQETSSARTGSRTVHRRSFLPAVFFVLVVLLAAALVLYAAGAFDSLIGSQQQARVQALVNQGRAAMNVGDYQRAVGAFGEALALAPTNEDVKTWYAKATRFQQMADWYAQADADMAALEWDGALQTLRQIVELDPTYLDVVDRISYIETQRALQASFDEALQEIGNKEWDAAIPVLQGLLDANYRQDEVSRALADAYFQKGIQLLSDGGESLDVVAQAIKAFDNALSIMPDDTVTLEKGLAESYRQGRLSMDQMDWPRAVSSLKQVYDARPNYMQGRAMTLLCEAYLRLGDAFQAAGDLPEALQQYRNVLSVQACDHVEAALKERDVYATLYPPTPTPTSTPRPTRTALPTATPTATPTITPLPPPPPTPPPTQPPR